LLIVGSRIVTAEVFAFTTSAEIDAAASTPSPAARSATPSAAIAPISSPFSARA
jgi:hypothetical protein